VRSAIGCSGSLGCVGAAVLRRERATGVQLWSGGLSIVATLGVGWVLHEGIVATLGGGWAFVAGLGVDVGVAEGGASWRQMARKSSMALSWSSAPLLEEWRTAL
jgi:hypothetical protein